MQAAWTAAALGRAKKMPSLSSLMLAPQPKPQRADWRAMYAVAEAWAASAGVVEPGEPTA